jgi:hypothetical protein
MKLSDFLNTDEFPHKLDEIFNIEVKKLVNNSSININYKKVANDVYEKNIYQTYSMSDYLSKEYKISDEMEKIFDIESGEISPKKSPNRYHKLKHLANNIYNKYR